MFMTPEMRIDGSKEPETPFGFRPAEAGTQVRDPLPAAPRVHISGKLGPTVPGTPIWDVGILWAD